MADDTNDRKRTRTPKEEEPETISRLPMPGMEAVTERYLARWFTRQWNRWQTRREKDQILRDRVYRNHLPTHVGSQGEGNELIATIVRSGTVKTLLREFVGIFSGTPPRIEALAQGVGPLHQDRADEIESWDHAWFDVVQADKTIKLVDADQILYGRGIHLVQWVPQFWRDLPTQEKKEKDSDYLRRVREWKKTAPVPITWRHKPAPQCLWDEDDWSEELGPPHACAWELRPLSELAARYPKSKIGKEWLTSLTLDKQPEDPLRLYLCFANRKYIVYASASGVLPEQYDNDDLPVAILRQEVSDWEILQSPQEHRLGRNPFVIQGGDTTSDYELANRYEGLFDNTLELVDRLDDALTQFATLVRRYARAVPVIKRQFGPNNQMYGVNPATGEPRVVNWDPDRVLNLLPGEDVGWWASDPSSLTAAQSYTGLLQSFISRDTLAPTTFGSGPQTSSGYQLVTMIEAASRKLKPLLKQKQKAIEAVFDLAHRWVVQVGEPDGIYVPAVQLPSESAASKRLLSGEVLLTPKMAAVARVRVTAEAVLQSAEAANVQLAMQLGQIVSQGGLDIDMAWILQHFMHIESPQTHRDAAVIQRFMRKPELEDWLARQALEEAGLLVKKDESEFIRDLGMLSPEELMLVPTALQQVLVEKGLVQPPGGQPTNPEAAGVGGVPGMMGLPSGGAPTGLSPQAAAMMSSAATPLPPSPASAATDIAGMPRAPGLGMNPTGAGASALPTADTINLGLGRQFLAGLPRSPREAGEL